MERSEPFAGDGRWRGPSAGLRRIRELEALGGLIVCLLLGGGLALALAPLWTFMVVVLVVLAGGAIALGYVRRRFASWGYLERDEDLLVRRGVMFRRLSVVPYGRMQSVEVTAGPIERSFGLATVRLHTAAAATDARIPGLAGADSTGLRDRLASLGEANAEGL